MRDRKLEKESIHPTLRAEQHKGTPHERFYRDLTAQFKRCATCGYTHRIGDSAMFPLVNVIGYDHFYTSLPRIPRRSRAKTRKRRERADRRSEEKLLSDDGDTLEEYIAGANLREEIAFYSNYKIWKEPKNQREWNKDTTELDYVDLYYVHGCSMVCLLHRLPHAGTA